MRYRMHRHDRITINLSIMFVSPANLWIIHNVLKKKAGLAGLHKFPEEFFAHSDTTVGS